MRPIFLAFQDFVFYVIVKKFLNKNIARKISLLLKLNQQYWKLRILEKFFCSAFCKNS